MEIWPLAGGDPETFSVPSGPLKFFSRIALDLGHFLISGPRGRGRLAILESSPSAGRRLLSTAIPEGAALGRAIDATASPDGLWIASAHQDGNLAIWHIADGKLAVILRGFHGEIAGLKWARPNEPLLFAASVNGEMIRWHPSENPNVLTPLEGFRDLDDLQVSSDGGTAAIHSKAGRIAVFAGGRWTEYQGTAEAFALSDSGKLLAISKDNSGAEIHNLAGARLAVLNAPRIGTGVSRIRFALADSRVVADWGGAVVWDARGGDPLPSDLPREVAAKGISNSEPSALWAEQSENATSVIDLRTGRTAARIPGRDEIAEGTASLLFARTIFDFASRTHLGISVSGSDDFGAW